jgi:hypothetical protein
VVIIVELNKKEAMDPLGNTHPHKRMVVDSDHDWSVIITMRMMIFSQSLSPLLCHSQLDKRIEHSINPDWHDRIIVMDVQIVYFLILELCIHHLLVLDSYSIHKWQDIVPDIESFYSLLTTKIGMNHQLFLPSLV